MNGTVEKNRARARRMSPVERKSQLLRAALKVSAEKGLGACYHRDLAEMTGVSVPTAFHYFPTSDDLVSSVIDEVTRFLIDFVQVHIVDVEEPGAIAVHDMLIAFADAIDESPDAIKIWLHWSAGIQEQYWKNYLAFCNERGEKPEKPFSGKFLVRVSPDVHRAASVAAARDGKSLNAWVAEPDYARRRFDELVRRGTTSPES